MKALLRIKVIFQFFALICVFLVIGSLGAWETGNIGLRTLLFQCISFSALGYFCGRLSAYVGRLRRRYLARRKAARHCDAQTHTVHAA